MESTRHCDDSFDSSCRCWVARFQSRVKTLETGSLSLSDTSLSISLYTGASFVHAEYSTEWCREPSDCDLAADDKVIVVNTSRTSKLMIIHANLSHQGTYKMSAVNRHGRLIVEGFTIRMAGKMTGYADEVTTSTVPKHMRFFENVV